MICNEMRFCDARCDCWTRFNDNSQGAIRRAILLCLNFQLYKYKHTSQRTPKHECTHTHTKRGGLFWYISPDKPNTLVNCSDTLFTLDLFLSISRPSDFLPSQSDLTFFFFSLRVCCFLSLFVCVCVTVLKLVMCCLRKSSAGIRRQHGNANMYCRWKLTCCFWFGDPHKF